MRSLCRDFQALEVIQVKLAWTACLDNQAGLGLPDLLDNLVQLVPREIRESLDRLARMVCLVLMVSLVLLDPRVILAWEELALKVIQVSVVYQVLEDLSGRRDLKESLDSRLLSQLKVRRVRQDLQEAQDS